MKWWLETSGTVAVISCLCGAIHALSSSTAEAMFIGAAVAFIIVGIASMMRPVEQ